MELRCPQCGALNREDSLDFPLCHQCHEELVRCRQCRHFAHSPEGCTHPVYGPKLTVSATTLPPCGAFLPRPEYLAPVRPRALSQMPRALLALLAVALLGAVLMAAS